MPDLKMIKAMAKGDTVSHRLANWTPPKHDLDLTCLHWGKDGEEIVIEYTNKKGERCSAYYYMSRWASPPESDYEESLRDQYERLSSPGSSE
jgi:hypothetical protein